MLRHLAFAILLTLAACGDRGQISVVPSVSSPTSERRIFVATTRQRSTNPDDFTDLRTSKISFADYTVSIPPTHTPGQIEWPSGPPNPATDFVTTKTTHHATAAPFLHALNAHRRTQKNPNEVVLFIHGFNSTFAEGTYRSAQMAHDTDAPSVSVHYSWPATQQALQYTHDRDSVLFARDGLHRLLDHLSTSGTDRILVLAHSIGAQLLMETLRQIAIAKDTRILSRIGGVVLISPDIDLNLFETQIRRINPLPRPFIIFGAQDDLALKLSSLLTGQRARLGQLNRTRVLGKYGIEVINLSNFKDGDGFLNHSVAITSPTVLSILRQLPDSRPGAVLGAATLVRKSFEEALR